MNAFNKAEKWRARAIELRHMADDMREPATRSSLLKIAAALEQHAAKLEAVALLCRRRSPAQPSWKLAG